MTEITEAKIKDQPIIQEIAKFTWDKTYSHILSKEQIEYMLNMMYSEDAILDQMENLEHHFLLIKSSSSDKYQGFVSYELNYSGKSKTKIHKLYVLPECQGTGFGRILIEKVISIAKDEGNKILTLNVNRDNKSSDFYKYIGFQIAGEEDINIGNGYLMEDYILEKII